MRTWVQGSDQIRNPSCCPRRIFEFQSLGLTLSFTLSLSLMHNLLDTENAHTGTFNHPQYLHQDPALMYGGLDPV